MQISWLKKNVREDSKFLLDDLNEDMLFDMLDDVFNNFFGEFRYYPKTSKCKSNNFPRKITEEILYEHLISIRSRYKKQKSINDEFRLWYKCFEILTEKYELQKKDIGKDPLPPYVTRDRKKISSMDVDIEDPSKNNIEKILKLLDNIEISMKSHQEALEESINFSKSLRLDEMVGADTDKLLEIFNNQEELDSDLFIDFIDNFKSQPIHIIIQKVFNGWCPPEFSVLPIVSVYSHAERRRRQNNSYFAFDECSLKKNRRTENRKYNHCERDNVYHEAKTKDLYKADDRVNNNNSFDNNSKNACLTNLSNLPKIDCELPSLVYKSNISSVPQSQLLSDKNDNRCTMFDTGNE
ncbi:hypothetical protein SNEBB_009057 [Seison nebaliae]|nr:hypothetical protein SNEBB_009057 [Seison nebaliae]